MGDTLFGGEKSGTPLETRAGTSHMADMFRARMRQGGGSMAAESFANMFGISPTDAGVGDVVKQMLMDPANRMQGLFASQEPFERRQMHEAVSGTRGMFGTAGGRFSRNLGEAEARTRGELANQFARTRQEGLLGAQAQQGDFLTKLFQLASQAGTNEMGIMANFFQPGAPYHTEGLLPGLLATAGNIYAGKMFGNRPNPWETIPREPTINHPGDPFGPGGSAWGGGQRRF